ncbi:tubulin alpha-4 chain [Reticulomyxa filosa]|uniref:Tubulin alpha chain n=1 Tax=Reticulomyxa filosa TaxID=46433 RepID=X6NNZ2_RETFI|nr:tubulin alpha-4 chain [Reticulomyxa filosa]|eukprot:ETO27394.1 tubulin alpha-4 chain [Reticulomyxa filosa]
MREIITIQVGQAGIQVGNAVWEQYCAEHNISTAGKQQRVTKDNSFKVFFEETSSGQFVDLEPDVIDNMKSGPLGSLFDKDFLLSGKEDSANIFSRGCFLGKQILDKMDDQLRKLADNCDNLMGFMVTHSIGGGTGSGVGALIFEGFNLYYKKKVRVGCSIFPSYSISSSVVEPYNALFAVGSLLDFTDIVLVFDNESMYNICQRNLHIAKPDVSNVNRLIAKVMSSMTVSLRFGGELNASLDELQMNLIPFPRLHFLTTGMSPIVSKMDVNTISNDVQTITDECFKPTNWLVHYNSFDPMDDKYMSIVLNYRGNITSKEANTSIQWLKKNDKVRLVEWCPTGFKIGLNDIPATILEQDDIGAFSKNAVMIANNIGISRMFNERITRKFDLMYNQRAFVHWYLGYGRRERQFGITRQDLGYLERDYLDVLSEQITDEAVDDYVNDDNNDTNYY